MCGVRLIPFCYRHVPHIPSHRVIYAHLASLHLLFAFLCSLALLFFACIREYNEQAKGTSDIWCRDRSIYNTAHYIERYLFSLFLTVYHISSSPFPHFLSTTASNPLTRSLRSNTDPRDLLSHEIITYGHHLPRATDPIPTAVSSIIMTAPSFLTVVQTSALKELSKFTGDPTQKVTQFIDAVEHIGHFTALDDSLLHSIATIKLGGAAFNWYDNNKDTLQTWAHLKAHLLQRFKPSLSVAKMKLKNRQQQPDESLMTYYDDVIDLCKQVDDKMPLHMIVDYLQDGIRADLKIHVKRQMKLANDVLSPAVFLKIARDEEELQHETSYTQSPSNAPHNSYFNHFTAAISTSATAPNSFPQQPHSPTQQYTSHVSRSSPRQSYRSSTSRAKYPYSPCLICQKTNHRTIDCYQKQATGCYRCGDSGHNIRQCPQVFP